MRRPTSSMSLIYNYRTSEDRELMAKYWSRHRYNGDTSRETMVKIKADLESLDHVGLAWVWREANGGQQAVQKLPDDYDPWR